MRPMTEPPHVILRAGAATDPGRFRDHNEDSNWAHRPVFLVADGMGGHASGDVASAEAVRQFSAVGGDWTDASAIHTAMATAASNITALAGTGRAPGTTLAGVAVTEQAGRPYWLVFNVGDSRVYLARDGRLEQVSVDHSRRQELIDQGLVEESKAIGGNVITRARGGGLLGVPVLDQWLLPLHARDRVLVCSDGLSSELTPMLMLAMLRSIEDPEEAATHLVRAAVTASGRDNVTAVVVDVARLTLAGGGHSGDDTDTLSDPTVGDAHDAAWAAGAAARRRPGAGED